MIRIFKHRKAVSPVIATIMMILIVIIGMGLVFAFTTVYTANYQNGIGSSVLESLTIENIQLGASGGSYNNQVTIWVYNSGEIASTINGIYIDGIAATAATGGSTSNIPVPMGQHVQIIVDATQASLNASSWNTGDTYSFRITTLRGSSFDQSIEAT